jgi:(+)-pinoresinol hydroxylase
MIRILALAALLAAAPAHAADRSGAALFAYHCAACHAAGPGHPGTAALAYRDKGAEPAVLTERTDLTPELIAYVIRNGINAMPYFRKTEISDRDIASLSAWLVRGKVPGRRPD